MATKKQKIWKRKTFRGGMERNGPIHPFKTYSNVQQFLAGKKRKQGRSYSNIRSNSNSNINNNRNSNKSNRKSKKRGAISEYSDKVAPNKVAIRLAKDADEESAIQASRQDKRQAAEERAEAARQSVLRKKIELLPPLTSNVGKPMNHDGKKAFETNYYKGKIESTNQNIAITEKKIKVLENDLMELGRLSRTFTTKFQSVLQSPRSYFNGTPTRVQSIRSEIDYISKEINEEKTRLEELKKELENYETLLNAL